MQYEYIDFILFTKKRFKLQKKQSCYDLNIEKTRS